jgi:hypothetical protein
MELLSYFYSFLQIALIAGSIMSIVLLGIYVFVKSEYISNVIDFYFFILFDLWLFIDIFEGRYWAVFFDFYITSIFLFRITSLNGDKVYSHILAKENVKPVGTPIIFPNYVEYDTPIDMTDEDIEFPDDVLIEEELELTNNKEIDNAE